MCERQGGNEAASSEITVTPEMIEAGVTVYLEWCPDTGVGDSVDRKMVQAIFSAMQKTGHAEASSVAL